jgi:hypothetical protein
MPGTKTSVWLSEDLAARWKASGLSLTEIVRRGLDATDPQDAATAEDRAALREELAANNEDVRRIVREELERVASR